MSSYSVERYRFIAAMEAAGMPRDVATLVLRNATTIERCALLACNSEAADRDRVKPPKGMLVHESDCDSTGRIPRIDVTSWRAEYRITRAVRALSDGNGGRFDVCFSGDPRGYTTRILRPGDRRGEQYSDGVGVPVSCR